MAQRTLPEGRYGSRARGPVSPVLRWALLVVALVVGGVVAWIGYQNLGTQPIESEQAAFEVLDDSSVEITVEVARDRPERPAVCIVRARSEDGDEAGRREVLVPPAEGTSRVTTVLRTSKPPVTGEVFGCSYQVPAYLSTR